MRKAAEQDHAMALALLALLYIDGQGLEKAAAAAERWVRKAARQGNTFASDLIGFGNPDPPSGNKGQGKTP